MSDPLLFDASSLVELLLGDDDIAVAFDERMLDLTVYEAANALWKVGVARDQLAESELDTAVDVLERLEAELRVKNVTGSGLTDTVAVAREHGLTVYDAAYLVAAERHQLTVVTEDSALRDAADTREIGATSIDALT
jgi:predicted nucleic acid-binding protein